MIVDPKIQLLDGLSPESVRLATAIFDEIEDIAFFVKCAEGKYVSVNKTLANRCESGLKSDILGKKPQDVFGKENGRRFEAQDQTVIKTLQPIVDLLELHPCKHGQLGWCLTTKLPVFSDDAIVGIVGYSRDLGPHFDGLEMELISKAMRFAEAKLSTINVERLAELANMSTAQLNDRLKRLLGLTSLQWLTQVRIQKSRELLEATDLPVTQTAFEVGYADHSSFTRAFKQNTGMTPSEYRNQSHT